MNETLEPQKDYREWCEENNVQWTLAEQMSFNPQPYGNVLYETHAIYQAHQVLMKSNLKEQK